MKLPLLMCMMLAFTYCVSAADTDTVQKPKHRCEHDVFINTTYFLKQIISISNSNLTISPYIVGYKFFVGKHHGLRASFGGNLSKVKEFPSPTQAQVNSSSAINGRIGYEYKHSFGKFWTFFTGMDLIGNYGGSKLLSNTTEDVVTTKTTSWSAGGGPVLGIQINIHKRISLFTETGFYYTYGREEETVKSVNFPEVNNTRLASVTQTGQFLLPTSVYFVFKF